VRPHQIDFEVANALRGHVLAGKLTASRGRTALNDYASLTLTRYDGVPLLDEIWRFRNNFTAYDAYLTLAQALGSPLATSDDKMLHAERLGVDVRMYPAT
jgi:predicted nucleic acid-binding protein